MGFCTWLQKTKSMFLKSNITGVLKNSQTINIKTMANFFVGKKVIWKKEECEIVAIEKGKKTKKIDYQNGVMPNGFKSLPKRYVLNTGQKVTGQDLINHNQKNKL